MYLTKVNWKNSEDVKEALISLCESDCDMNGENGDGYLWDEAKGYNSNAEYLASRVGNEFQTVEDVMNAFKNFMNEWMNRDGYYDDYEMDFISDGDELIVAMVLIK